MKEIGLTIREAMLEDVDRIMEIYDAARAFMRSTGNLVQWINGYPSRDQVGRDIASGSLFVCVGQDDVPVAVFCFVCGPDPTYAVIENGQWLSDDCYYVVHRMGSDGSVKGIAGFCLDWCRERCFSLRIDTHADNRVMQHILEREGFTRCGIIYVSDGTPRIAYQRNNKE